MVRRIDCSGNKGYLSSLSQYKTAEDLAPTPLLHGVGKNAATTVFLVEEQMEKKPRFLFTTPHQSSDEKKY